MNGLFGNGLLQLCGIAGAVLQKLNYKVMVIEEEAVALAPGDMAGPNRFFPIALLIMFLLLAGTLLTVYFLKCRKYKCRLAELGRKSSGWNMKKLKEMTAEMEWDLAAQE